VLSLLLGPAIATAQSAGQGVQQTSPAAQPPSSGQPSSTEAAARRTDDEPELDVLTFHRTNYFITGFENETQAKFQFSIKYDFWPSTSRHTVYFGFTQKSLWDLFSTSSPFRESNYAPELFYAHYHSEVHGQPNPGCGLFSEQAGIEHESNGEKSEASRSWNRIFVDAQATCYGKPLYGLVGLRLWYPLGTGENDTIAETQGYGELLFGLGVDHDTWHMNGLVTVSVRKGASTDLGKGSLTVDARWRPTYQRLLGKAWRFVPYVWFQFFTGYGETLGTFASTTTSLRLGVGFSDRAR
jgi:outer membrane phospholipase A